MILRFFPGQPIIVFTTIVGPVGSLQIRLLLDTGAVTTMIDAEVLVKVGLEPLAQKSDIPITTASGVVYVPQVRASSLEALGVCRKNFPVNSHTLPPSAPVDGLLGLDFLIGLRLTLDMKAGELTVDA